jgi:hypothetical protein
MGDLDQEACLKNWQRGLGCRTAEETDTLSPESSYKYE